MRNAHWQAVEFALEALEANDMDGEALETALEKTIGRMTYQDSIKWREARTKEMSWTSPRQPSDKPEPPKADIEMA